MSPVRIPEGSVFVPRRSDANVAAQLLEAAEQLKVDRHLAVRTTTGGYHVFAAVADRYQENLGETVKPSPKSKATAKSAPKTDPAE